MHVEARTDAVRQNDARDGGRDAREEAWGHRESRKLTSQTAVREAMAPNSGNTDRISRLQPRTSKEHWNRRSSTSRNSASAKKQGSPRQRGQGKSYI